jgi:glycyl-tRNA synthetase
MTITVEELAAFCKRKGFVFPSSEIYGGLSGFFDFGPLGVELFNNIKQHWWKFFVQDRQNMVGMDGSVISHPRVWKASGHVDNFGDFVLVCSKCKNRIRADHFIEDVLKMTVAGLKAAQMNKIIEDNKLSCPKCKGKFEELKDFNLLFRTFVGAEEDKSALAYLRGETAQGMFVDFKQIADTSRVKLPFGIAQVGKCFRNEISPRDFMFRCREFTIGEFEFFIHPEQPKCDALTKEHLNLKVMLLDSQTQEKGKDTLKETTIGAMIKEKRLGEWHAYWLAEQMMWFYEIGLKKEELKIREHVKTELSHYSSATFDIDFAYPFGSKEIAGNANRGQFDLTQHTKESKEKLELFDEETKSKVVPAVIEPTFGMDRVFLATLVNGYHDDKARGNIVLKLAPQLAPLKVAVFPLLKKDGLDEKADEIYHVLRKEFATFYDASGSIGRRYARQDEVGTPFCITVDHDSLKNHDVTIRDRDTTQQVRIKIKDLKDALRKLIAGELAFKNLK